MKKYLLDTSICVFLFRRKYGIAEKLQKVGALLCVGGHHRRIEIWRI